MFFKKENFKKTAILYLLLLFIITSCQSYYKLNTFDLPRPVDTSNKPIDLQEKKVYSTEAGVYADNQFDGARLNDFIQIDATSFEAWIKPENAPINPSPWYAFKLWSDEPIDINLTLKYEKARHRYSPEISTDGKNWTTLPDGQWRLSSDTVDAILNLSLSSDTLWVAAQEIQNSTHVRQWCEEKAMHKDAQFKTIGKSKLNRPLFFLDISDGLPTQKPTVIVISRQHPPEVTGYFAMQAFIDEILEDNPIANDFRQKYRVMVFPLLNPDGVDLGHWRHNAGGIDLNRDWAYYRQPEIQQITSYMVNEVKKDKNEVVLGLDFHSTWHDVYYTNTMESILPNFRNYWLTGIEKSIEGFTTNQKPSGLGRPVSKAWFFLQFQAEGVTYEIGDDTSREFIEQKGRVSAMEMMELLVYRKK